MMEVGSWLLTKLIFMVSALFGAFGLSVFWMPKHLKKHTLLVQGLIIGGIAVGFSLTLGGFVLMEMGLSIDQVDNVSAVGFLMGLVSVGTLNFLGNFFDKREDKDLLEIYKDVKDSK